VAAAAFDMNGDRERVLRTGFDGYLGNSISILGLETPNPLIPARKGEA
jgi:hypothetical protein